MNDLLDQLLVYSYQLYKLNMKQAAGDYDYLVAWLRSVDPISSDKHYGVVPAGENTVAPLANNCPIPYTATRELVKDSYNSVMCLCLIRSINEILAELNSYMSSDDEITAINSYLDYTNKLVTLLERECYPFDPPEPVVHHLNISVPDKIAGTSAQIYAIYDGDVVEPIWTISPQGPIISDNIIEFTESGTYTITAKHAGMTVAKSVILEYKDGWTTETSIDDSGDYPVSNTVTIDPNGNKESETVAYIDGEQVNTGFELEPGDEDTPIVIDEGKDTKIYTFDGENGFELFFKFHYDPSLQPPSDYADKPGETDREKHYTLLNMKYEVPPYPGIAIRHDENADFIRISLTPLNPTNPENSNIVIKFPLTEDGIYDIYMRYEPSAPFEKFVIVDNLTGQVKSKFEHYTYEFSNEVTATLGYVNAGTIEDPIPCRQSVFDVYDFRLNKIMSPWKEIPTVTETSSLNGLLITKEITNDDRHLVKRMSIEPDITVTEDEYVLLEDGLVFNDIIPFIDEHQTFELEFDVKVDYEDQIPYNGNYQVLINMIPEVSPYPGFCARLEQAHRPSTDHPTGQISYRLRYVNDRTSTSNKLASAEYNIDEDHIVHYRYIYEGDAVRKCSAFYSYKSNAYRIFTKTSELYAVQLHDYPLCIGCALDANRQKFRECKMYIKKIEYIRNIKE